MIESFLDCDRESENPRPDLHAMRSSGRDLEAVRMIPLDAYREDETRA